MPTVDNWRALELAGRLESMSDSMDMGRPPVNDDRRQAAAELRRLAAEVEALRADAGRYRWMRHHPIYLELPRDYKPARVDRFIDEVMKGTP